MPTVKRRREGAKSAVQTKPSTDRDWRRFNLRLALLTTALSTGVLAAASVWPASEAWAGCVDASVDASPNTVNCDTAQTTNDVTQVLSNPGTTAIVNSTARHFQFNDPENIEVTITTGGDIDGFGLAVESTQAGAAISVNHQGAIGVDDGNTPTAGGTGVFNLTTDGGDVTYIGNGSVIDNDGGNPGLVIDTGAGAGNINIGALGSAVVPNYQGTTALSTNSGTGDQNIFLEGGSLTPTQNWGVQAIATTGDINIDLSGNTVISAAAAPTVGGVSAFTGGNVDISSDAIIGSDTDRARIGIFAQGTTSADVTLIGGTIFFANESGVLAAGGTTSVALENDAVINGEAGLFGIGVHAIGFGGLTSVSVGQNSSIVMDGGTGIFAGAGGATGGINVTVDGTVAGADLGIRASMTNAANPDDIVVTTSGVVQAVEEQSIWASTAGTGDVTVSLSDGASLQGGVLAESTTGDAAIITGDNVTVIGNSPGLASVTAGGDATQVIGNNVLVTGSSGVVVDQTNPAGTGVATVQVGNNSTIIGDGTDATDDYNGNGIFAGNQGTGLTAVVTGTGTSVTGDANGIVAFQTNAANTNDITISTDGPVTGAGNTAFVLSPYTDAFVGAGLPTTGIGIGASTAGTGDIIVTAGDAVQGANAGIQTLASGGNIAIGAGGTVTSGGNAIDAITTGAGAVIIGTQAAVVGGVNGIRAASDTGSLLITANGPVSGAGEDGIQATSPGGIVSVTANAAVSGADDGIDATGNIVAVTSNVSASGGDNGIEASGGQIAIGASGTTTGGTDGIQARSTTGENITITTAGVVTGGDDGVDAIVSGGGGNISIAADAAITGGDDGIFARTEAGDIGIAGSGDIIGVAGQGIDAASTAGGSVDVNVSGAISGQTGILLSVVGAGTIGVTTGGPVTGTVADGITTSAVNGDTVIATSGNVTGADDGIDATATGAGSVTVSTLAGTTIEGTAGNGIAATTTSGNVLIGADAEIEGGTNGIFARTGTGNIVVAGGGDITGTGGSGIDAASATGGNIDVNVSGDVSGGTGILLSVTGAGTIDLTTGDVTGTTGDAINTAAATGATTITTNGTVDGADDGIDAASAGGPITVTAGGDVTGGANGILVAAGTGPVAITTSGAITGNGGDGIQASGGTVAIDFAGAIAGTDDGIQASATGDVTIAGSADVTGDSDGNGTGDGIFAASTAGGDVAVDVSGEVTGARGIVLSATGAGTVDLVAGGTVTGTTGDGINTTAAAGATTIVTNDTVTGAEDGIEAQSTAGAITITNNAAVTGTAGDGIATSNVNGDTTINAQADVTGGEDGIEAAATGTGAVDINVAAGVTVTGETGSGVLINTNTGTGTINNGGFIEGAFAAISGATNSLIRIVNTATGTLQNLTGLDSNVAIQTTGSTQIENAGLITGRVNTGAGNDEFDNTGVWATEGTSDFGAGDDIIRNSGRLVVADNPAVSEETHLANLETFINQSTGIIDMVEGELGDPTAGNQPGTRDTLTIDGRYVGEAGSEVQMDLALATGFDPQDDSDLLVLDAGDPAQGTSDFVFNIVSTGAVATTENNGRVLFAGGQLLDAPITVVQNRGDLETSSGEDDIPLARSGFVDYDFVSTAASGGDYQVVSQLNEALAGGILLPIPATLAAVAFTTQRSPSPITSACIDPAVKADARAGWARGFGGEAKTETSGETDTGDPLESRNTTRFATLQGGFDGVLCDLDNIGGNLHLGLTLGHTWGDSEQTHVDSSEGISGTDIEFESFFVGPYAAYTRGGLAVRGSVRFDFHELELSNPTPGLFADSIDFSGSTISGSADTSYQFELGRFNLTPEVGINISNTDLDNFEIAGATVVLEDLWSVMGHVGLTGSTTIEVVPGAIYVSPFASGTLYHEFEESAEAALVLGGVETEVDANRVGTFGQVGLGMNLIKLGDVTAGRPTVFGGARADVQFGDRIEGFDVMAFGRVQF